MLQMRSIYPLLLLLVFSTVSAQDASKENAYQFQDRLNREFADSTQTPLNKEDLRHFKKLNFFPVTDKLLVQATFFKIKGGKVFNMPTTTSRAPRYKIYGLLRFQLEGKDFELFVYQNLDLKKKKEYRDYLFLPFTDYTNGIETYGGGRYIDFKIPKTNQVMLDFNKAYNPYCAYNKKYSCPIVPEENDLKIEIKAGVKKFHD